MKIETQADRQKLLNLIRRAPLGTKVVIAPPAQMKERGQ